MKLIKPVFESYSVGFELCSLFSLYNIGQFGQYVYYI